MADEVSRVEDSFSEEEEEEEEEDNQEEEEEDNQPDRGDADLPSDDGSDVIPVIYQPRQVIGDWVPLPGDNYHLVYPFRPIGDPGPTHMLPATANPINFFELFLSNRFLRRLVRETNTYADIVRTRDPDGNPLNRLKK